MNVRAGIIALSLIAAPAASARIGETPAQCLSRYTNLLGKSPAAIPGSDPEAETFHKEGTDITVHYRNGLVWHIAFIKTNLSQQEREIFLRANAGPEGWPNLAGERFLGQTCWVDRVHHRAAVAFVYGRESIVEIMTAECVEMLKSAREQRLRAAISEIVGMGRRAPVEPPKSEPAAKPENKKSDAPPADPLKGF